MMPMWIDNDEAKWLAEQACTRQLVIEIGRPDGLTTLPLSCAAGVVSVGITADWFRNTAHLPHVIGITGHATVTMVCDAVVDAFGRTADMVYVEAAHARTVWLAKQLLKRGGIICGGGYCDEHPETVRVVNKMLPYASNPTGTIWTSPG